MPYEEVETGLVRVYGKSNDDGIASSSFIILDRKVAAIDTGVRGELWKEVIDVVKKYGKDPKKDLNYLLVTHEHPDHFGSALELKKSSGAKIYAHSIAAEVLRDPTLLATRNFNVFGDKSVITNRLKASFGKNPPVNPDTVLMGSEKVDLGNSNITIIHTGGHCSGHTMYYDDLRKVLFAGDEVIESPSNPCKYIIDLTGSADRRELVLKRLLGLKIDVLAPAHASPSVEGDIKEQINRAIDANDMWRNEVRETVAHLGEGTSEDIANLVQKSLGLDWSGELKPVATAVTTQAYLRSLSAKGEIEETKDEKSGKKKWAARQ